MWFFAFILLCVIIWVFFSFFVCDCLVKHLDILFNFFLKIDLIWWVNLVVILSRVLWGRAGLYGAPRGGDGVRKFSPSCGAGRGWGKTIPCGAGTKTPSFTPPRPIAIPNVNPRSGEQLVTIFLLDVLKSTISMKEDDL